MTERRRRKEQVRKQVVQCVETDLLTTGHIYGEKLTFKNFNDIIEIAIPTSINERTLVWVRAGGREWATKSEPNQVFQPV